MARQAPLLVVEDDSAVARALGRLLKNRKIVFKVAASMEEALNARGPFQAAIIDLELPDGSGLDLFERLHASQTIEVAVFFSATTDSAEIEQANARGLFIPKQAGAEAAVNAAVLLLEENPATSGERLRVQTTLTTSAAITKTK